MRPKIRIIATGGSEELRSHVRMIFSVQPMFKVVDGPDAEARVVIELGEETIVYSLVNSMVAIVGGGSHFAERLLKEVRLAAREHRGPKPRSLDSKLASEVAGAVASEMRRKAA